MKRYDNKVIIFRNGNYPDSPGLLCLKHSQWSHTRIQVTQIINFLGPRKLLFNHRYGWLENIVSVSTTWDKLSLFGRRNCKDVVRCVNVLWVWYFRQRVKASGLEVRSDSTPRKGALLSSFGAACRAFVREKWLGLKVRNHPLCILFKTLLKYAGND